MGMADSLTRPYYNRCKSLVVHWHHLPSPSDCWLIRHDVLGRMLTIDDLPDGVLIEIFDFYVGRYQYPGFRRFGAYNAKGKIESWKSLIQVCRRWRGLVLASPRRLNLQLLYIPERSARKSLDLWPAFPLHIFGTVTEELMNNVIPGLEDRICQINLVARQVQVRKLKIFGQQCRCRSRSSQLCTCILKLDPGRRGRTGQFFPIHSWVDLRHVFDTST